MKLLNINKAQSFNPAFLDTNVLSALSENKMPELAELIQEKLLCACFGMPNLQDLQDSNRCSQISNKLEELSAVFLVENEDGELFCSDVSAQQAFDPSLNLLTGFGKISDALTEQNLSQHRSEVALSQNEIDAKFNAAFLSLEAASNEENLVRVNVMKSNFSEMREVERKASLVRDQVLSRVFPNGSNVNSYAPPGIVEKILAQFSEGERAGLLRIFDSGSLKERALGGARILSQIGFGRDKRIHKSDRTKALRGASSDLQDYQIISYGLHCTMFFSGDKATVRRAYALKEFNELSCEIVYANPDKDMFVVDKESWSDI